ncbi:sororin [Boleophthalmus pectinirostris]|uniref:sororin n=1 Tax=Boleophthalmus pectinirostris TaxID=150288 RepID=UPI002430C307|nr:sororin [Boleophthalmus pectinirostris]
MPLEVMKEVDGPNEPQRRRSARLSPPQTNQTSDNKMAPSAALVKRRITVKKIAPRKTTLAPSEHDKENTPKRTASEGVQLKKQKISTPDNVHTRNSSSGKKPKKPTMPSPILPSPPPALTAKSPKVQSRNQTPQVQTRNRTPRNQPPRNQTPKVQTPKVQTETQDQNHQLDPADKVWSQKVRRSYSRLSDKSLNSPNSRLTLFGFEKLQTPEVIRKDGNKTGLEASRSLSGLASFMSLLEAEDCVDEPDLNIPGVVVVKEKRKRKKVQPIDNNEMEELAAKMNAEFEEAEEFELFVE